MKRWWPLSAEAEDPPLPLYSSSSKTTLSKASMPVGGRLEKKEEVLCLWSTVTFLCVLCFFFWLFSGTLSYLWCDWGRGMSTAVSGTELWRPQGVEACVDGCWINTQRPVALCCVLRCFVTAGSTPTCEQRSSLSVSAADGPEGLISGKS